VRCLCHADLEGAVRVADEIAAIDEAQQEPFPHHLLESLRALIGSEASSYSELDRVGQRTLAYASAGDLSADDPGEEVFWALRHEWPTCSYEDRTLDFGAHMLSDFVTTRELRRLQIYNDLFRPWRLEHEISVGLPAPLTHTKLFLFFNGRDRRDFEERDRTILTLLRPHLVRRYDYVRAQQRAAAALAALETSDEPIVLLGEDGRAEFATSRARRLLSNYGFDVSDVPNVPPLRVRRIRADLLLLEERRPLGLTPREREILALVAEGKTNAQIASLLWISPSTVGKHLENAYAKLGATSRTAAVRIIRDHDADDIAQERLA
jgi:DNA-binding CsgD family transcriptional regulator